MIQKIPSLEHYQLFNNKHCKCNVEKKVNFDFIETLMKAVIDTSLTKSKQMNNY